MPNPYDLPFPQYRCPRCARDLPLGEARMTVTCAEHQEGDGIEFVVREATSADQHAIEEICDRALGETDVDVFGTTFDVLSGTNLIADSGGQLAGLLSLSVYGGALAIVLLSVYPEFQGAGVGRSLLEAAHELAATRGLSSVRVAVTNDDIPLLYFYQRHGFVFDEVATGVVADQLGAAVPGFAGIPVRDEIRLRRPVCRA